MSEECEPSKGTIEICTNEVPFPSTMSEECEPSKGTIEICINEVVGSQFRV